MGAACVLSTRSLYGRGAGGSVPYQGVVPVTPSIGCISWVSRARLTDLECGGGREGAVGWDGSTCPWEEVVPHSGTLVSLLEVPGVSRCGLRSSVGALPCVSLQYTPPRPDAGGYGYRKHRSICCPRSPSACLSRRYVFVIKHIQHLWSIYCMPAICWRWNAAVEHL